MTRLYAFFLALICLIKTAVPASEKTLDSPPLFFELAIPQTHRATTRCCPGDQLITSSQLASEYAARLCALYGLPEQVLGSKAIEADLIPADQERFLLLTCKKGDQYWALLFLPDSGHWSAHAYIAPFAEKISDAAPSALKTLRIETTNRLTDFSRGREKKVALSYTRRRSSSIRETLVRFLTWLVPTE